MRRRGAPLTGWRRIANAIWSPPSDPQIYGLLEIDASNLQVFLARADGVGHDVTVTHLVGRAVAHALARVPALNIRLRRGRLVQRGTVDVFFIAAVAGGRDLTGVKVRGVDRLSAIELGDDLRAGVARLRRGEDPEFNRSKALGARVPLALLRPLLRAAAILAGDLGWSIPALGVHGEPFGSAMVSSLGSLGIPIGFVPIAWLYRVPLLVAPGVIAAKVVAVDGRVEVRPMLPVTVTVDHRYADGAQLAAALAAFRAYLEDPAAYEPCWSAASRQPPSSRFPATLHP